MYTAYFIAHRLRHAPRKAFTAIVHKIGIISIALGLATTLIAFLIMQGFQRNLEQKLTSFNGHLQITKYSLSRDHSNPPLDKRKLEQLKQNLPHTIKTMKPFTYQTVLLRATEDVEGIVCKGLDLEEGHDNLQAYLTAGRLIAQQSKGYSHEVLLSTHTANRLQVQVGDEVLACVVQQPPRYRKLKVVGLYTTHVADLDEKLAFCDLKLIQRLNNWPRNLVGGYEVFLHDLKQTRATAAQVLSQLDYDMKIKTTKREYAAIFDWLTIVRKNALIFMVLILVVASSNLASIVLIQMMERTSMIGILKSLGASDGQICRIMLGNNLLMVVQGTYWGNLVGLGCCLLQRYLKLIPLNPTYYYIDHVPIVWDWGLILGLNVLVFGVVTAVLAIAIALIIRLRPIRAIQFR